MTESRRFIRNLAAYLKRKEILETLLIDLNLTLPAPNAHYGGMNEMSYIVTSRLSQLSNHLYALVY